MKNENAIKPKACAVYKREKTCIVLKPHVKKKAMKLAAAKGTSISRLIEELMIEEFKNEEQNESKGI